jgi:hypothetical protein
MTKYVYVVVAFDSWRDEGVPRYVGAFLTKEAADAFEKQASGYAYQFGSQWNHPFDSPFDPEAKSPKVWRAPWYDVVEVELKGL